MMTTIRVVGKTYDNRRIIKSVQLSGIQVFFWNEEGNNSWQGKFQDHQIDEVFDEIHELTDGDCRCEIVS